MPERKHICEATYVILLVMLPDLLYLWGFLSYYNKLRLVVMDVVFKTGLMDKKC